jgi:hypothetical protein
MDELVLDPGPDDAGHLIAVELDNGVFDFDLLHAGPRERQNGNRRVRKDVLVL